MIFLSVVRPKGGLRRPGRGLLKKFPEPKTARFNVRGNYRKDVALTLSVALSFFKDDKFAERLSEVQMVARLKLMEWIEDESVNRSLAKAFEDTLYKRFKR